MRSRTRNIIIALSAALIIVFIAANYSIQSLQSQLNHSQTTVASLANENQANYGRAEQLQKELDGYQLVQDKAHGNDQNVATTASTLNHLAESGTTRTEASPTVAYFAKLITFDGRGETSHVIPSIFMGKYVDGADAYELRLGTMHDGQPAVFVFHNPA